jgi:hypothetical protein
MSNVFLSFFFFLILGFVFIINYVFNKKVIVKGEIKKHSVSRIADFKEGKRGRVTGRIVYVDTPLEAPLSGRTCCHYYVRVEERGKDSYNVSIQEEITGTVVIQDGEHYALIKSEVLDSYIVQDRKYSSGTFTDITPRLEAYLNERGHDSTSYFGLNKSIRYNEGILEEGERITVVGLGEWKQATDVGLPESYGRVLVMHGGNDSLYLTDARDIVNQK